MLEFAFNLTNDPLFYIVTFTVLVNLSGISASVFLCKHLDAAWLENPKWSWKYGQNLLESQGQATYFGLMTNWISKLIRRRESPQDDAEDHVSFLEFAS